MTPDAAVRHHRRAAARHLRRFDHHRPHLPGRRDQARQPGRHVSDRASGRPRRLQLLRRAPRQSRSDDARHLRQHPHQEQDGPRHRGRHHQHMPDRRDDADLRRGDALQGGGRPARRHRRQGIWHRLVARLGGQGHQPARRPRRHRRDLRAHPPLEPGRHGRAPAAVRRRRCPNSTAARPSPSSASPSSHPRKEIAVKVTRADGTGFTFAARVPHRYRQRARIFPAGGILHYVLRALAGGSAH